MPLDIGLSVHNGYPVISKGVTAQDVLNKIRDNYTGEISSAIQVVGFKNGNDSEGIQRQMQVLLESRHICDEVRKIYPGLFSDDEEIEWDTLLDHVYSTPENFKLALEYLSGPLGELSERFLGENVIETGNYKSLGDVIDKVENFPTRLQGNPRLPERYKKVHSGKVRETYQHPDNPDELIMIATDRISTHDVIHMGTIPGKGKALTKMSNYWFNDFARNGSTKDIPNQLVENPTFPEDFPDELRESATIVKKLNALPIEAIVRGYLYGSALKGYDADTGKLDTGEYIGKGLQKCSKFPRPMFTPSTKSDDGDDNVNFETMVRTLENWLPENGYNNIDARQLSEQIKDYSLRLYERANVVSQEKGLILGDTKYELGLDKDGNLTLIDEACTADSSRLWTAETVVEGQEPESHDKQPTRDEVIEYWRNNPDRNGRYYPDKKFKKYPVPISENVLQDGEDRYTGISGTFSEAA